MIDRFQIQRIFYRSNRVCNNLFVPMPNLSLDGIGEVQNTGFTFSISTGVAADFFGFNSRSRKGATAAW